ncbi:hypothetical protein STCU_11605 [Strigomonas culicis]|uniref:Uncharacterized protein n=1 Tax=Strigomonas culicis TaxID=28005 RepID=S9UZQ6_9TRYP|nr:hypothetical protein STCU_11605 [Strigomonas culicis]|eukprot:EPY16015.1 hypothetical protein STCU_11605 [Strigomonas culicis]
MPTRQRACEVRPTYMSFTDVVLSPQSIGATSPPANLNNVKKWMRRALQLFATNADGVEKAKEELPSQAQDAMDEEEATSVKS